MRSPRAIAEESAYRPTLVLAAAHVVVGALARGVWRLTVRGLRNVPADGPLIVASNHVSLSDGPMLTVALGGRRCLRFLGKVELFRVPVLGWFLKAVGGIPVDRGRGDVPALRAAVDVVRGGGCLGLFPEGTRSKDGRSGAAKAGLGFLARETRAWVVPAKLVNTDRFPAPCRIEVRFGAPMRFEGAPKDRQACLDFAGAVMERVRSL
ncbi:MAG: 1-acyl-sn-glycerol-3-phosphate acyltransferase [Elusimicrobia bacterium]|nr:1-acyl-sn-glycerol-3-phosphate acyltransferase [Elusimicrobiota bacterium]